jgi:hypothetical protein
MYEQRERKEAKSVLANNREDMRTCVIVFLSIVCEQCVCVARREKGGPVDVCDCIFFVYLFFRFMCGKHVCVARKGEREERNGDGGKGRKMVYHCSPLVCMPMRWI